MSWKQVVKNRQNQPQKGTYSDWKEQIAEECSYQCVYCSIHEAQFGGIDHYHIDHFRPLSKFPELQNDILNLFYSCPICNRFKSDDWPCEPELGTACYINPSENDYNELFDINDNFEIKGKYVASSYIILRLFLNRAQLILERRESSIRNSEVKLREKINELVLKLGQSNPKFVIEILQRINAIYSNLLTLENKKREIRPYELKDIRKSEK
jgi:hypothetical protein